MFKQKTGKQTVRHLTNLKKKTNLKKEFLFPSTIHLN